MSDERLKFSHRLAEAMQAKGYEPKPGVLLKLFNSRYKGRSIAFSSASKWLRGMTLPDPDKLRVLADLFGVEPHVLQYGGPSKTGEGRQEWSAGLGAQDRAMVDGYLTLPAPQRKLVRELVAALADRKE
ncbi:MAG: transcriptional regulator [Proteobacteria bacterium]|mgnify:CR=1 FL=1|nr:transcriptional regulator [Pseudomonadota bacterium]